MTSSQTTTWRLWIDRCGGFLLLAAPRVDVGGARPDGHADVQVQSDWRRYEGSLIRSDGDYFWTCERQGRHLVHSGEAIPVEGSATMRLTQPSPLSGSAVLSLDPPHRFGGHVDQVLLVDQTVLVGPGAGNHVRSAALSDSAVVVLREGRLWAKVVGTATGRTGDRRDGSQLTELVVGSRVSIGDIDMMLEEVANL